ncbi:flavin reductase (DIM6/NTAB) family NADH-FMN oxidoreductase RutF [Cohnella lupini]|uniref:Flavin reductase (DIM6/NTAB) family NADH-FMN oxidoreductase RutF n=2 Tax=Cohnella lupini TaxID=1294267 RepID=A0A3D9I1J9_9BACL|nr:flavin reductase (DIM6/NTAB) family NADH-FMN oxidoreductase RutF [Cohnella lupini]
MGKFATGITVITTRDAEGKPQGMTVNAFTSLSLDPPMLLVCLDNKSATLKHILESKSFCVNILSADQENVSRSFARRGDVDKFEGIPYLEGVAGVPVLDACLAYVVCGLHKAVEGGDHQILLGDALHLNVQQADATPLVFYGGKYGYLTDNLPQGASA